MGRDQGGRKKGAESLFQPPGVISLCLPWEGRGGEGSGKGGVQMHLVMLSHTRSLSLTGFLCNSRHLSHKASACQGLGPVPGPRAAQRLSHLECEQVTMFIPSLQCLWVGKWGSHQAPQGWHGTCQRHRLGVSSWQSLTRQLPGSRLLRPASPICGQPCNTGFSSTWPFRALLGPRARAGSWGLNLIPSRS